MALKNEIMLPKPGFAISPAIVMNIGADIAGMGAVGNLLFPSIQGTYFSIVFTIILLVLIIYGSVV